MDLRASDADRELIVDGLRFHHAAGRLDDQELEDRIGAAFDARTRAELSRLVADLPPPEPRPGPATGAVVAEGADTLIFAESGQAAWQRMVGALNPGVLGYAAVDQAPYRWVVLQRERRPWWVWLLVVFFFPIGLLALLIKERDRLVVAVDDAGAGHSRLTVSGSDRAAVAAALARLRSSR